MSAEHGQLQQSGGRRGRSPGDKKSRRRSRRKETYSMYIYKVLKQVSMGGPPWAWGRAGKSLGRTWMEFRPGHRSLRTPHAPLVGSLFISEARGPTQCPSCTCGQEAVRHAPTLVQRLRQGSGADKTVTWGLGWGSLSEGRPQQSAGLMVIRCPMWKSKQEGPVSCGWREE